MVDSSDELGAVFDEHVKCEFVTKDVEATMRTHENLDRFLLALFCN